MSGAQVNRILVIVGQRNRGAGVWGGVRALMETGASVSAFFVSKVPPDAPDAVQVHRIRPRKSPAGSKPSLRRIAGRARELALAARARTWKGSDEVWRDASRDAALRAHAKRARMIVAVDRAAVPVVWRLGRLNRDADLVLGYPEAIRRLSAQRTGPGMA